MPGRVVGDGCRGDQATHRGRSAGRDRAHPFTAARDGRKKSWRDLFRDVDRRAVPVSPMRPSTRQPRQVWTRSPKLCGRETARSGVDVSVVVPGVVDTGFFEIARQSLRPHAATTDTRRNGRRRRGSSRRARPRRRVATAVASDRADGARAGARRVSTARGPLRRISLTRLTATQRNPICVVALSCDCGERAAGRYRWQYSGAHRCEPPLSV